jgi:hypothetical protein
MISKILNFFLPKRKTMLQLAKDKLSEHNIVFNTEGPLNVDVNKDGMLIVGTLVSHKIGSRFDSLVVLFNHNNNTVAIKQGEEVIFYFNAENEVQEIKNTLTEMSQIKGSYNVE